MEAPPQPPSSQPTTPPLKQPSQQLQPPPSSSSSSSSSSLPSFSSNPNPNTNTASRPQQFNGPWSQLSHFSTAPSPSPPAPPPRGGIAMGLPATRPPLRPAAVASSPPSSFSPSFASPQYPPARPPVHGSSNTGMISSQIRPGGVPPSAVHQLRVVQGAPAVRPQNATNNQPPPPQNIQGHGLFRGSSVALPSSSTLNASQDSSSPHQPWLSSASHGRPPLPSQSSRPLANSQVLQQRSHIPQQFSQPMPGTSQSLQLSSSQQQQQPFPLSNQSEDNHRLQLSSSIKVPQPSANQQQMPRGPGLGNQRPPSLAMVQPCTAQPNPTDQTGDVEAIESSNRIVSKRSIQEIVNQIDPSEKLDPDVEDVLVDIAEDFIDSITTFGCSLAKHRKSSILEAKDILLHLERTWNMTLPGFTADEIKTYKKPAVNEIHRERLSVVKKSIAANESGNKSSTAGSVKGHSAKSNLNVVG